jgi:hypothetical protein
VVYRAVCEIGANTKSYSTVVLCGSAEEGTKVGLPDEADFLAVASQLGPIKQSHVKDADAGYDYVYYYSDQTDRKLYARMAGAG